MKISIHDIAKKCNVSIATVSRVFNQQGNVREEVRTHILNTARELGYVPRGLNKKKIIAIITPSYDEIPMQGYLGMAITELTREIFSRGYSMEIIPIRDLYLLNSNFIVGAVFLAFENEITGDKLTCFNIPIINVNHAAHEDENIFSVCSNEQQGMELILNEFYKKGHRKVGLLISKKTDNWTNSHRTKGFIKAINERKLHFDDRLIQHFELNNYFEAIGKLIQTGVTGIICAGEDSGPPVIYALNFFGKKIPEEISLVSYEYRGVSQFLFPSQTTIGQNFEKISECSLDIIEDFNSKTATPKSCIVDYELILRESVATRMI